MGALDGFDVDAEKLRVEVVPIKGNWQGQQGQGQY